MGFINTTKNILKKARDNLNTNTKDSREIGEIDYNAKLIGQETPNPQAGFSISELKDDILKSFMPEYLYRPPYGYPRKESIETVDLLAKNPYIFAINKAIQEEIANMKWDICLKEDYIDKRDIDGVADEDEHNQALHADEEGRQFIKDFLNNPNINNESFNQLLKMAINDIVKYDSGVWVKVFDKKGSLKEIYARKGGSFLKNTTVFGTMHNRAGIVLPLQNFWQGVEQKYGQDNLTDDTLKNAYTSVYTDKAAYFQYGQNYQTFPVPFGTREVVYMSMNPQSSSIYGQSPISILQDTLLTLVYGGKYNLDFYLQNNMPEGIISLKDANPEDVQRIKAQWENNIKSQDEFGKKRKQFFKMLFAASSADFVPFNLKPADMQILEQQKYFHRLVMMCFGMSENELGVVEDVNRANGEVQFKITNRRAILPYIRLIEHAVNTQILSEFPQAKGWEFKFKLYDLEEDIRKHSLYEQQINMGIKTPLMVAEEEGIDIEKLKEAKERENPSQQENTLASSGTDAPEEEEQEMPKDNSQEGNFQSKSSEISKFNEESSFKVPQEIKVKSEEMYDVPQSARNNAKKVLKWKEEYGDDVEGMTETGWKRARQLASGDKVSFDIVKRMAQFNRHRENSKIAKEHKNEPWKDAGYVAWLGWGGDSGINWAIRKSDKEKEDDDKKSISTKSKKDEDSLNPIINAVERTYQYIDDSLSKLNQDTEL